MYGQGSVIGAGAAAGGGLAMTGLNVTWVVLGAFALIAAGSALLRVLPKREA